MAMMLEPSDSSAITSEAAPLDSQDVFVFPSSLAQQRFWFLDQLEPGNPAYNIAVRWSLLGQVDPALLELAINEVLRRHEVLRTRFHEEDGLPLQVVVSSLTIPLPVVDLRQLPEPEREAAAERVTLEIAKRPFDLQSLPLIRTSLLQLSNRENTLLVTVHHAVADGWSIGLIAREMCELYAALAGAQHSPLPDLPVQYADFAAWQAEWLNGAEFEQHTAYWKGHLQGVTPFELVSDRPRPALQTSNGTIFSLVLPRDLTDRLQGYTGQQECTFFTAAVAAFATLLYRYTGQDDIAITTQVAGRNRVELENLVGLFINTVVLRFDLSGNPLFPELLQRAKKVIVEAIAHQDMPFEQLVDNLKLRRDLSRKALFQVNFIYQRAFVENVDFAGNQFVDLPSRSPGALYDLNVFMVERVDGWRLSCEYNTDLYNADTVTRMLGHFQALFASIATNPGRTLSELPILPEAERKQLLASNCSAVPYPREATIHQLFELQAERSPDAVAVVFGERSLSYRQLNDQANQLAHYLTKCGVGRGSLVGICIERSLDMMVALLGVLKAGGAYVPLDPAYPPERLAYMLEDAGARVVVTQRDLARTFPDYTGRSLCIDKERDLVLRESTENIAGAAAEDLAYVIYTSGSTGRPKGVLIPHRAVVNLLCSMRQRPGITPLDKLLAVTTLSFDIAGLELFLPLIVGAQVVIASRETVWDGPALVKLLKSSGATILQATPATWRLLIEADWQRLPRLKILCGGEAWSRELAIQLLERGAELWNMYGPTETTIWSSVDRIVAERGPVLIGPPIDNTQFYILDTSFQPVPIGVAGELFIGGDGLSLGYLNRDALSREKFVLNPFTENGERLYRTGDLVRRRSDDKIEFLGRLDQQAKIRGYRIEMEEIQAVLLQHPGVHQAVVVIREMSADDRRLVAYVIPVSGLPSSDRGSLPIQLRDLLRTQLPDYMIPTAICLLDQFPLTANGKIDRAALPAPEPAADQAERFVAPRDELEAQLCRIWEDVLHVPAVSVTDDFFDLGGHSLLAVRLFTSVRKLCGKNLPLVTLFQAPTVEKLALVLRSEGTGGGWSSLVPIQVNGSKPPLYIISGLGGNVVRFRDLSKHLGTDQPVYALQPPGLDGKRPFLTSVEAMAGHYISEIRTIHPTNTLYYLAGYSFGGVVTFEMAQQLSAAGASVGLLALLDAPEWGYLRTTWKARGVQNRLLRMKARFRAAFFGPNRLAYLHARMRRRISQVLYGLYRALGRPLPQIYGTIEDINSFAAATYVPIAYRGRLTLFRTVPVQRHAADDSLLGWGPLADRGVEVYEVPGDHEDMTTEPNVRILAERLSLCIESTLPLAHPR